MNTQSNLTSAWSSIRVLTDHLAALSERGDWEEGELRSLMSCMPEWATFHEVRSALGAAGYDLMIVPQHRPVGDQGESLH